MDVSAFTPVSALIGGALIGLSAVMLMALNGRIAGITGIALGALLGRTSARHPAHGRLGPAAFLAGLVLAPVIALRLVPGLAYPMPDMPLPLTVAAGLLVGFGAALGSGCTSGHGICGLSRLSGRSLVAVATFMSTAALTVFITRHLIGG